MAGVVDDTQKLGAPGETRGGSQGACGGESAEAVARATTMTAHSAGSNEDPWEGRLLGGRYRLGRRLGAGAMGAVYRAHHEVLARPVAVKVLRPELAHKPAVAERFEREALAASRLDHPNCVQVLDAGTTNDGLRYLVMPLLEGRDLRALLGEGLDPARAIDLTLQILCGLGHAHRRGFVHRDVKPENVLVVEDDDGRSVAKLVDFGLVKLLDLPRGKTITRVGFVFGTPWYMSPEQAAGEPVDARADLYAVGAMLYEMLSGAPPFDADSMSRVLYMHVAADPRPLPSSVPAGVAEVVMRLLAKEPRDRYASARAAADALRAAAAQGYGRAFGSAEALPPSVSGDEGKAWVLGEIDARSSTGQVPSFGAWSPSASMRSVTGWSDGGALLHERVPTSSRREVDSLLGSGGRGQKVFGAFAGLMTAAIGVLAAAFVWSGGAQASVTNTEPLTATTEVSETEVSETEVSAPVREGADDRLAQAGATARDDADTLLAEGVTGARGSAVATEPVNPDPEKAEGANVPAANAPDTKPEATSRTKVTEKPKPTPKATPKPTPPSKSTPEPKEAKPASKEPVKVLRPTKPPRTSDPASKLPSSGSDGEKRRLSPARPPRQV